MRRQLIAAPRRFLLVAVIAACLTGCSAGEEATVSSAQATASVTQSAPSVWSTPDTVAQTTVSPDDETVTADPLASSVTALPGLTTLCTAVIHAQAAVNKIFASALANVPVATGSAAATEAVLAASAPMASTATTPLPSATEISALFDKITPQVPASLATAFAALKDASLKVIAASPDAVPDVLAAKPVVDAMKSVSTYISACTPATTD